MPADFTGQGWYLPNDVYARKLKDMTVSDFLAAVAADNQKKQAQIEGEQEGDSGISRAPYEIVNDFLAINTQNQRRLSVRTDPTYHYKKITILTNVGATPFQTATLFQMQFLKNGNVIFDTGNLRQTPRILAGALATPMTVLPFAVTSGSAPAAPVASNWQQTSSGSTIVYTSAIWPLRIGCDQITLAVDDTTSGSFINLIVMSSVYPFRDWTA